MLLMFIHQHLQLQLSPKIIHGTKSRFPPPSRGCCGSGQVSASHFLLERGIFWEFLDVVNEIMPHFGYNPCFGHGGPSPCRAMGIFGNICTDHSATIRIHVEAKVFQRRSLILISGQDCSFSSAASNPPLQLKWSFSNGKLEKLPTIPWNGSLCLSPSCCTSLWEENWDMGGFTHPLLLSAPGLEASPHVWVRTHKA